MNEPYLEITFRHGRPTTTSLGHLSSVSSPVATRRRSGYHAPSRRLRTFRKLSRRRASVAERVRGRVHGRVRGREGTLESRASAMRLPRLVRGVHVAGEAGADAHNGYVVDLAVT